MSTDGTRPGDEHGVEEDDHQQTRMLSSEDLAALQASNATGKRTTIKGTPRLVGRSPSVAGIIHPLEKKKNLVGRDQNCDLVLPDNTVSSRHAQVIGEDGVWRVVNLISTNGTAVNGQVAIVNYLAPGDSIAFGNVEMVFEAEGGRERTVQLPKVEAQPRGRAVLIGAGIAAALIAVAAIAVLLL